MSACGWFSDFLEYQGQTAPLEEPILRKSPWLVAQCVGNDQLLVAHATWKIVDDRLTLDSVVSDAIGELSPSVIAGSKPDMRRLEFPIAASWFSGQLTLRNQSLPGFFGHGYGWKRGSVQFEVRNGLVIGRRSLSERVPLGTRRRQRSRAYDYIDRS